VEDLVGTTDIFATILDIAGCKLEASETVSGISLSPLLHAEKEGFRDEIFMEQEETRAIRTSQWLFMMRIENTEYDFKHELYDLVNDPDERKNLAQDPEYADVVAKLSARLNEYFWHRQVQFHAALLVEGSLGRRLGTGILGRVDKGCCRKWLRRF
jgi:arylsulfatase A-like enzyme